MTRSDRSATRRPWGTIIVLATLGCVVALFVAKAVLPPQDLKRAVIGYLVVGAVVVLIGDAWQLRAASPRLVTSIRAAVLLSIFWPVTIVALMMPARTSTSDTEGKEPDNA